MRSESAAAPLKGNRTERIAAELDRLLEQHIKLFKAESFVGLTPAEWEEYERISGRIHELFGELGKLK